MLRSPAAFAFVLAELLFTASAGCSASIPARVVSSPEDLAGSIGPQVGHGSVDVENVLLPAVSVFSVVYSAGAPKPAPCSGVLVDPLVVITAGHCVCAPRVPTPQDKLVLKALIEPLSDAGTTDPRTFDELASTEIYDGSSSCSVHSLVTTIFYLRPGERASYAWKEYHGRVLVHPEFELVQGMKNGKPWTVRNHADLAAIFLDQPVPFPPLGLPNSEVKVGDALAMAGYGPTTNGDRIDAGPRRFGDNEVTSFVNFGSGNALIAAAAKPSPDGGAPANMRKGDSGGPCVRKSDPNVLAGISTTGGELETGGEISLFTSAFQHKGWILETIQRAHHAEDAGVSAPSRDAGLPR